MPTIKVFYKLNVRFFGPPVEYLYAFTPNYIAFENKRLILLYSLVSNG